MEKIYNVNVNNMDEEARASKRVLIHNEEEFRAVSHRLLAKDGKQFAVTTLAVKADDEGTEKMQASASVVPVSLEAQELEKYVAPAVTHLNVKLFDETERFCPAYINVRAGEGATLAMLMRHDIWRVVRLENGHTVDEGFFLVDEVANKAKNLCTLKECKAELLAPSETLVVHKYCHVGVTTPGQLKKGEISLYCSNLPGFDPEAHLDKMTWGAYSLVVKHCEGKMDKLKALAQFSTRLSQFGAGIKATKPVKGFAVSAFKLEDAAGNEWADGLMQLAAEDIADAFSDNQFLIMPSSMDGEVSQERPFIVNKGLGHVVPQWHIIEKMKATAKLQFGIEEEDFIAKHIIFLAQDELTEEQFKNYMDAVLDKAGPYYKKTVVILPSFKRADGSVMTDVEKLSHVGVWVDLNVHKTVCDIRRQFSGHNVMSFGHGKESVEEEANISSQLLASALAADPLKTLEYFQKESAEAVDGIIAKALATEGRRLRAKDLLGDINQAVQTAFPQFAVKHWAPYYQDGLNKRLEGFAGRLEKLKVGTDGIYLKIIPDLSHFFGISLLKYNAEEGTCEVLAPQLTREGIDRAIAVKYPKMATDEFAKLIPVSPDTLAKRARMQFMLGKINKKQLDVITHELRMLHEGVIIVPCIESLKNMLAGMDFDGDALIAYTDEKLVSIIWAIKPVATTIMEDGDFAKFQAKCMKH